MDAEAPDAWACLSVNGITASFDFQMTVLGLQSAEPASETQSSHFRSISTASLVSIR